MLVRIMNMSVQTTVSMLELTDCDIEIVKARLSVIRELCIAFGIEKKVCIPCTKLLILKRYAQMP